MSAEHGARSAEQFRDGMTNSFVPARPVFAREVTGLSAGGIEGIEEGPRRSIFARRNRFRPGRLGNMLARAGQLRRVA